MWTVSLASVGIEDKISFNTSKDARKFPTPAFLIVVKLLSPTATAFPWVCAIIMFFIIRTSLNIIFFVEMLACHHQMW